MRALARLDTGGLGRSAAARTRARVGGRTGSLRISQKRAKSSLVAGSEANRPNSHARTRSDRWQRSMKSSSPRRHRKRQIAKEVGNARKVGGQKPGLVRVGSWAPVLEFPVRAAILVTCTDETKTSSSYSLRNVGFTRELRMRVPDDGVLTLSSRAPSSRTSPPL